MIRRSWTQAASIEETLELWAASLREIKTRIRPLFGKSGLRRTQACFWKVCLEMSNAKRVGCAQRQLAILALGGNRRYSGAGIGGLVVCAVSSAVLSVGGGR